MIVEVIYCDAQVDLPDDVKKNCCQKSAPLGLFKPRQVFFFDSQNKTQNFIFPDALAVLFNFSPPVILCFAFVSDLQS